MSNSKYDISNDNNLNFNNKVKKEFNLRCYKCEQTSFISLNYTNNYPTITNVCQNGHLFINDIDNFLKLSNFRLISCSNNDSHSMTFSDRFYCTTCLKFYCTECMKIHDKNHYLLNYDIDFESFCLEHNEKKIEFCFDCQKTLCNICLNSHQNHNKINLLDNLLTDEELINNVNKLNEAKNFIDKIELIKFRIIKEIEENFEKYKERNLKEIYLLRKLLENYKKNLNNGIISYELIENIRNIFNFNNFVLNDDINPNNFLLFIKNSFNDILLQSKKTQPILNNNNNNIGDINLNLNDDFIKIEGIENIQNINQEQTLSPLKNKSNEKSIFSYSYYKDKNNNNYNKKNILYHKKHYLPKSNHESPKNIKNIDKYNNTLTPKRNNDFYKKNGIDTSLFNNDNNNNYKENSINLSSLSFSENSKNNIKDIISIPINLKKKRANKLIKKNNLNNNFYTNKYNNINNYNENINNIPVTPKKNVNIILNMSEEEQIVKEEKKVNEIKPKKESNEKINELEKNLNINNENFEENENKFDNYSPIRTANSNYFKSNFLSENIDSIIEEPIKENLAENEREKNEKIIIEKINLDTNQSEIKTLNNDSYMNITSSENNINNIIGKFKLFKTLENHKDKVMCLIILSDGRLASCSLDKNVYIYNKITFEIEITITEKYPINYINELIDGSIILCSNIIKIIKFNNNKDYKIKQTLYAHNGPVIKVIELFNENFASLSEDKTIKIWNRKKPNLKFININTLKASENNIKNINCVVQILDNEICTSDFENKIIYFWNINTKKIIFKIGKIYCSNSVDCMVVYENILIVCGESLYLIDINSKKILKNLNVLYQIQTLIEINDDYFITGDVIGGLKEWKIDCKNQKVKLISDKENAHEKCIESLMVLENDVIVSASDDNKIKVWN